MEILELNKVFSADAITTFDPKTVKTARYILGSQTEGTRTGDIISFPEGTLVVLDSFEIEDKKGVLKKTKAVPCVAGQVTRGTETFGIKLSVNAFAKMSYGNVNEVQILPGTNPETPVHSVEYTVEHDPITKTNKFICKDILVGAPVQHYFARWNQDTGTQVLLPTNHIAMQGKKQLPMSNK